MSLFDTSSLLEQTYDEEIDTNFYLCPPGEYQAQITELRLREGQSQKVKVTWTNLDIVWDILDENLKVNMNMQKVQVTQQLFWFLKLDQNGDIALPARPDWSVNRNMPLKRVMRAVGFGDKVTDFSLAKLKYQTAYVRVEHELDRDGAVNADGSSVKYARVTRVSPLSHT